MQRRDFIRTGATTLAGVGLGATTAAADMNQGAFQQSVCKWCFPDMSVEALAVEAKRIGLRSIELLGPGDFETLRRHDLICAMVNGPTSIPTGGGIPHRDRLLGQPRRDG